MTQTETLAVETVDEAEVARSFRPDIDGLRAIAILLVVAFHAEVPGFSGGFIGVDAFFVISGYLITRNLLSETARTGGVRLLEFWARRIRRLVPALAVMLAVVLALALLILSPLEWRAAGEQARAAALYVSNFYFANRGNGYFAAGVDHSLFLHTWSLGVEEQFYVVWPLGVAAACWACRRRREALRSTLIVGFAVVLVASLTLSVILTNQNSPMAFFGLPSHAWEFAAAGLLAAVGVPRAWWNRGMQFGAAIAGLALLAGATVAFSDSTPYPGLRALLPVVGTLLLIMAGDRHAHEAPNPVSKTLSTAPPQWLGRVSYSWYLWHWPLILLAVAWVDRDTTAVRVAAAFVALLVAWAAHRLIENPVRFSRTFVTSRRRTYAFGAAATVLVLVLTIGTVVYADNEIEGDDILTQVADARANLGKYPCPNKESSEGGVAYCDAGDLAGSRTVMLVGDSHAGHWLEAFATAAEAEGIHLVIKWHPGCPVIPVGTEPFADIKEGDCDAFRADTMSLIDVVAPDALVVSNSNGYGHLIRNSQGTRAGGPQKQADAWAVGYQSFLEQMRAKGIAVGTVVDNPIHLPDPLTCVADHRAAAPCATPRAETLTTGADIRAVEARTRDALGGLPTLDVTDDICSATECTVTAHGVLVYSDFSHLTNEYTQSRVPQIRTLLQQVTG